jgi:dienelactone hydrolase
MTVLLGFERTSYRYEGVERVVYTRGDGPGVLVMHEIPGITPQVAEFARRVADAGFYVALPVLFGEVGKPAGPVYGAREIVRACIRREFHVLASHHSSPITDWLRALCRQVHAERGGPGVGAIGMCLTGNFALSLMVDEVMMAPVLSQPSLPFPFGTERKSALHISPEDLIRIKERCAADPGLKVIGLRFTQDPMCPAERFETLRRELGGSFEGHEIDRKMANPQGPPVAHSVVTNHLVDEEGHPTRAALDRVLAYFAERLRP